MRWPVNWEWTYTFTQVWDGVKRTLKRRLARFCLDVVKWAGGRVVPGEPLFVDEKYYRPVRTDDLVTTLFAKLSEYERGRLYNPQRKEHGLILVGPDALPELAHELEPSLFRLTMTYAYQVPSRQRWGDPVGVIVRGAVQFPVYYLPDFVGIAVVPDMTGTGRFVKEQGDPWGDWATQERWTRRTRCLCMSIRK